MCNVIYTGISVIIQKEIKGINTDNIGSSSVLEVLIIEELSTLPNNTWKG